MRNVRIIARFKKIIDLKSLIQRECSFVQRVGGMITHERDKIDLEYSLLFSNISRYLCLYSPYYGYNVKSKVLCREGSFHRRTALYEKSLSHCTHLSRSYSNVEGENLLATDTKTGENEWGGPEAEKLIIKFEKDFVQSIKSYESLLVFFYTSWCKHCKKLKPVYGAAAVKMKEENVSGHLAVIDLTKRMDVADKFNIVSVPVMFYFKKGELMKVYDGKRTVDDIVNFMKNPPEKASTVSKIDI